MPQSKPAPIERRKHKNRLPGLPEITGFDYAQRHAAGGFNAHRHPGDLELVYLARGELCWWAGNEVIPLRGGDLYLTFPDEPHGSRDDLIAPCELYWFTLECFPRRTLCGLNRGDSDRLRAALLTLPRRHAPASPLLREFFIRLDRQLRQLRQAAPAERALLLPPARVWLAATLWEVVRCVQSPATPALCPEIAGVLRWLEDCLRNPVSLEEMARQAGLSVSFFKEKFRAAVGMSPGKYYLRRRVSAAAAAIIAGRDSLVDIALTYGFGSSQYLATCLRRETGRTPTQLRALAIEKNGSAF